MGISLSTALIIQTNKDIRCSAVPDPNGFYSGWISFWRDNQPHIAPLISSQPTFTNEDEAVKAMEEVVKQIRAVQNL